MSPEAASWWAKEFPSGTGPLRAHLAASMATTSSEARSQNSSGSRAVNCLLSLVSTKFLCRTRGFVPTGDGMRRIGKH